MMTIALFYKYYRTKLHRLPVPKIQEFFIQLKNIYSQKELKLDQGGILFESDSRFVCQNGIARICFRKFVLRLTGYQSWRVLGAKKFRKSDLSPQGDPVVHVPNVGKRFAGTRNANLKEHNWKTIGNHPNFIIMICKKCLPIHRLLTCTNLLKI